MLLLSGINNLCKWECKMELDKKRIKITVSVGVSHRYGKSQPLQSVFRIADKALYRAKKEGRNQVRFSRTE